MKRRSEDHHERAHARPYFFPPNLTVSYLDYLLAS